MRIDSFLRDFRGFTPKNLTNTESKILKQGETMNKIQKLLQELCPNGVEYKALGEVCEVLKGKQLNKDKLLTNGNFPVINGGIAPSGFWNESNYNANRITISQGGASAGFVNFITTPFWVGAHCYVIENEISSVLYKFLYYILKNQQSFLMTSQHGAGIPALSNVSKVSSFLLKSKLIVIPFFTLCILPSHSFKNPKI